VEHIEHLPPAEHRAFYNAQRFTLNITRADMVRVGYSPSVRLFEAAACATPIISDCWPGLDSLFTPGKEILVAEASEKAMHYLRELSESERVALGRRAQERFFRGAAGYPRIRGARCVRQLGEPSRLRHNPLCQNADTAKRVCTAMRQSSSGNAVQLTKYWSKLATLVRDVSQRVTPALQLCKVPRTHLHWGSTEARTTRPAARRSCSSMQRCGLQGSEGKFHVK
jgi:hypothetical protein